MHFCPLEYEKLKVPVDGGTSSPDTPHPRIFKQNKTGKTD